MVKDSRVTYRRRLCYNTKSNQIKKVKTPGGRLVVQYRKKRAQGPRCAVTGARLHGIPHLRPKEYKGLSKTDRTVNRAYGGVLSSQALRERVLRAFIIEEQKIVKKLMEKMGRK